MTRTIHIVTGFAAALIAGTAYASPPSFTGLGHSEGAFESYASGLSADGSIVAGTMVYVGGLIGESEAFRWTAAGGIELLGDFNGGDYQSYGAAVSNDGSVVAGTGTVGGPPCHDNVLWCSNVRRRAARFEGGSITKLDSLIGGQDAYATSTDMTGDGSVIIGHSITEEGNYQAARWLAADNNNIEGLGFLPGGNHSEAHAVSDDGSVIVGYSNMLFLSMIAYRWTESEGMVAITDGNVPAKAFGVSSDGSVIVGMAMVLPTYEQQAFRWTESTGLVMLGDLPGGNVYAKGHDVSADGSIVVGRGSTEVTNEAFIWDDVNGIRNLRSVLESDYGLDLSGWLLSEATAVSDDGRTICGYGYNPNGQREAWVAHLGDVAPCPADVDGNGAVDVTDLLAVLGAWGACGGCPEDVNDDHVVDIIDLLELLGAWGDCNSA